MSAKKSQKGPSQVEIVLGVVLSVALGIVLGAVYLALKPVHKVREVPKDAPSGAVYYIEGIRDFNKSADMAAKRKAFAAGESVDLEEGELNVMFSSLGGTSGPAKPADKSAPVEPKAVVIGSPNVRIHGGKIQFADTLTVNLFGVTETLIVQSTGAFERRGSGFEFVPEVFYVGGCPLQRIPIVGSWLLRKTLLAQPVPDDIAAGWSKLADVTIDGSLLKLKMP